MTRTQSWAITGKNVALFQGNNAINRPSLSLNDDEIATAVRYITDGANAIRSKIRSGANEVSITLELVGEMRAARSRDAKGVIAIAGLTLR